MAVKKKDEKKTENAKVVKFSKEQILLAKKYKHNKDVINVVLKADQLYTLDKVDELIDNFMKLKERGKVK